MTAPVAQFLVALAAEQVAGLIPDWASRPLYPWEMGTDFAAIENDQETAYALTASSVDKVRDVVLDAMTAALGDGTAEQVAHELAAFGAKQPKVVQDAIAAATTDIADALGITFERAGRGLVAEADGHGVPHSAVETHPSRAARAEHRAMAATAPSWVWQRLNTVATSAGGPTAPGKAAVLDAARTTPMDGGYDLARQAVHVAHGTGRAKAAAALPDPERIYASELLDQATCGPCQQADGRQYTSEAEAAADYPDGGYRACSGGHRCRGTLVYVWPGEDRPSDEGLVPYQPLVGPTAAEREAEAAAAAKVAARKEADRLRRIRRKEKAAAAKAEAERKAAADAEARAEYDRIREADRKATADAEWEATIAKRRAEREPAWVREKREKAAREAADAARIAALPPEKRITAVDVPGKSYQRVPIDAKLLADAPELADFLTFAQDTYGDRFVMHTWSDNVRTHVADLAKIPQEVHRKVAAYIADKGRGGIYLGDTTMPGLDELQAWAGEQPRGWPPGETFDKVPGAYVPSSNALAIGKGSHGSGSLALHEFGHMADDAYRRDIMPDPPPGLPPVQYPALVPHSESKPFRAVYNEVLAVEHRGPIRPYFLQAGDAGPSEMWGEASAALWSGDPAAMRELVGSAKGAKLMTDYLESVYDPGAAAARAAAAEAEAKAKAAAEAKARRAAAAKARREAKAAADAAAQAASTGYTPAPMPYQLNLRTPVEIMTNPDYAQHEGMFRGAVNRQIASIPLAERRAAGEALKAQVLAAQPTVATPGRVIDAILADGRYKGALEVKVKGGSYNTSRRTYENHAMGIGGIPVKQRPIYGYMDRQTGEETAQWYGEVQAVLRPEVIAKRATVTFGDSLNYHLPAFRYADLEGMSGEDVLMYSPAHFPDIQAGKAWPSDYTEIQVHGGLFTEDIDHWVLDAKGGELTAAQQKIKANLEAAGHRVEIKNPTLPSWTKQGPAVDKAVEDWAAEAGRAVDDPATRAIIDRVLGMGMSPEYVGTSLKMVAAGLFDR
jgi:hypothetical protein